MPFCCPQFFKGKDKTRKDSSSDSSPETTRKPQNLKQFIDDAVKTHNDLRKKHGVPTVKHAKDLSDYAQKWAEHMAATSTFGHSSCQLKSDRLGENIALILVHTLQAPPHLRIVQVLLHRK